MFQSWSSFLRKSLRFDNVSTSFETTSIVSILPAECIGTSQFEDGCDTSTDEHVSLNTPTDIFAEDFVVFQSFLSHRSGSLEKKTFSRLETTSMHQAFCIGSPGRFFFRRDLIHWNHWEPHLKGQSSMHTQLPLQLPGLADLDMHELQEVLLRSVMGHEGDLVGYFFSMSFIYR